MGRPRLWTEENTKKSCDFGNGKTTARTWELREVDNPFRESPSTPFK